MTGPVPAFRADAVRGAVEFQDWCEANRATLDARFVHEARLATEGSFVHEGTCAPCLRPARFACAADGGAVNWREQLVCDCPDRLGNRPRALLHFLLRRARIGPGSHVLRFGRPGALDGWLRRRLPMLVTVPRLVPVRGGAGLGLELPDQQFDVALAQDTLQHVPPLDAALAELHRVLLPGGLLVLTVPFRYRNPHSASQTDRLPRPGGLLPAEVAGEAHELGWDLLGRLRRAGFTDARAHVYWCEELGYLGPFNMIFDAVA